jgi:hypothetical protein
VDEATERQAEIRELVDSASDQLLKALDPEGKDRQLPKKVGILMLGVFEVAQGAGALYGPWKELIDEVVKAFRKSVPGFGQLMCDTGERLTISTAKAQGRIPADYKPPKA